MKRTRAEWNGPTSANTYVCSEHFTEECLKNVIQLKEEVGYRNRRQLKSDAVPTLFQRTNAVSPVQKNKNSILEMEENEYHQRMHKRKHCKL